MINYDDILSKSVRAIKPSGIRKFFDIVGDYPDAISLGVGEPDFVTPWEIRDAAIKSLQKGYTAYTSNSGLLKLREHICEYLSERFAAKYSPNEVLVTIGASEAIDISMRALLNPGEEVLVPDPSFVSYSPMVTLAGGVAVPIECNEKDGFKLMPDALEKAITERTKAVILPYPNNPTGTVLNREELEEICRIVKKHNLIAVSDEIYAELAYDAAHVSVAAIDGMRERTVLISGFSKAFAMTGWRIGYLCAPYKMMSAMLKIHQYAIMCAPTMSQYAADAALACGRREGFADVEEMRRTYDMRRRFAVDELRSMGLNCAMPQGAFYVFPSVKSTSLTGDEFAERLIREKHVAVVPGSAFGDAGKYNVRCSYSVSMSQLREAMKRIREFVTEFK